MFCCNIQLVEGGVQIRRAGRHEPRDVTGLHCAKAKRHWRVSSRNRQPSSVQNVFSSLRLVERVVKKQLKEGQLSESLASKFNWDKLSLSSARKPRYHIDKETNMRVFDTSI
ncbi:unnamed protein product [Leptidea sinapis]|uniref:Uncharacterized protein n=1 Tax=Leptidea sinapis TaxID=189913 RepID=A0A5E4Q6L0_9NEOP|nr:unnamed protein product [Leptidea sinapis]